MRFKWLVLALLYAGCSQKEDVVARMPADGDEQRKTEDVTLREFTWKRRVLLAFAPDHNEALRAHLAAWSSVNSGFEARDMLRFEVIGSEVLRDGRVIGSAGELRRRFEPEGPLTVVLIGKDGGEKARAPSLAPADVFETIDAMPMRQREME